MVIGLIGQVSTGTNGYPTSDLQSITIFLNSYVLTEHQRGDPAESAVVLLQVRRQPPPRPPRDLQLALVRHLALSRSVGVSDTVYSA